MKKILIVIGLILIAVAISAYNTYSNIQKVLSDDPTVWEGDIVDLEERYAKTDNPVNPVVFVGSSSIRFWDDLVEDMSPIPVLQLGFGGSKLNDVVHYADRLVNVYAPSAVVIFAGTNDILPSISKSPETLLNSYKQFVEKVRVKNRNLPIYYIAITPSIKRWEIWPIAQKTNQLISEYSASDNNLFVIDTGDAFMGDDEKPNPKYFVSDGLHLSSEGYGIWTRIIKPNILSYAINTTDDPVLMEAVQ